MVGFSLSIVEWQQVFYLHSKLQFWAYIVPNRAGIYFNSCKHTFTIIYVIFSHLTSKKWMWISVTNVWSVLTWTLISIWGVGIWKYFLKRKVSPFTYFYPSYLCLHGNGARGHRVAHREPAAENENSHLQFSAESYKLLYKEPAESSGHYGLWCFYTDK